MTATCFPYGFPTSYSRPPRGTDRLWPRCVNAEPGTFGHECGVVAAFVGTKTDGFQAAFCEACRVTGFESRGYGQWIPLVPLQRTPEGALGFAVAPDPA